MQSRRRNRRRKKQAKILPVLGGALILLGILIFVFQSLPNLSTSPSTEPSPIPKSSASPNPTASPEPSTPEEKVAYYAKNHGLSVDDYPESIIELLGRNPETEKFVMEYPFKKDTHFTGDLEEYANCTSVPLLLQWDQRWGYSTYGDDVLGITGCGPTCLSMVAIYMLHDTKMNPEWMAEYSTENGYCVPGNGTSWTLMSKGASGLGLHSTEIPLVESRVIANLEAGNPIICIMGPGDFTQTGHYIVLTGYEDGKLKVNDPNSQIRSEKLWDFDKIQDQILNLWVFEKW